MTWAPVLPEGSPCPPDREASPIPPTPRAPGHLGACTSARSCAKKTRTRNAFRDSIRATSAHDAGARTSAPRRRGIGRARVVADRVRRDPPVFFECASTRSSVPLRSPLGVSGVGPSSAIPYRASQWRQIRPDSRQTEQEAR
jgi:hypothetical protein